MDIIGSLECKFFAVGLKIRLIFLFFIYVA